MALLALVVGHYREVPAMFDQSEMLLLSGWCAVRAVAWLPILQDGRTAVLLEPRGSRRCWQRTLLTRQDDSFELTTEAGELLACASDLNSVLDALEGGLAEPVAFASRPRIVPRVGALVL